MDLQLVLSKPAFQQLLVCEFKGDLFVCSHSHGGLKFLQGPPYRTATETIIIALEQWFPLKMKQCLLRYDHLSVDMRCEWFKE